MNLSLLPYPILVMISFRLIGPSSMDSRSSIIRSSLIWERSSNAWMEQSRQNFTKRVQSKPSSCFPRSRME